MLGIEHQGAQMTDTSSMTFFRAEDAKWYVLEAKMASRRDLDWERNFHDCLRCATVIHVMKALMVISNNTVVKSIPVSFS